MVRHGRRLSVLLLFAISTLSVSCKARRTSSTKEVRVAEAVVTHQGKYGTCTLYALSTFLTLWNNSVRHDDLPPFDAAYLAMSVNRLNKGGSGTLFTTAFVAAQKYGAIPSYSTKADGKSWLPNDWPKRHDDGLMDVALLDSIVNATYKNPAISSTFTPKEMLRSTGVDFANFKFFRHYQVVALTPSTKADPKYRGGSEAAAHEVLRKEAGALGIDIAYYSASGGAMYENIVRQLYSKRPVMVAIKSGAVEGLPTREVLTTGNIKTIEPGTEGLHAVVVVGHCDRPSQPQLRFCQVFAKQMLEARVPECLVIQNSWGISPGNDGQFCLSRYASQKIILHAALLKTFAPSPPIDPSQGETWTVKTLDNWTELITTNYITGPDQERDGRDVCMRQVKAIFPKTRCVAFPDVTGSAFCSGKDVALGKRLPSCVRRFVPSPYQIMSPQGVEIQL